MNKAQLRYDIEFLAGHLVHRGASTHSERAAAEYIRDRFQVWTLNTNIDDFHTHGNTHLLFACYLGESLVVALLGHLMPWLGFVYGAIVFSLFFFEHNGYELLGRFLPRFDTQNVSARFLSSAPKQTVIVTAHYDSPKTGLLHGEGPGARVLHAAILACMLLVTVSCAAEALSVFAEWTVRPDHVVRWSAALILTSLAFRLVMVDGQNDYLRGAIDNASGVAAMLGLAQSLTENPAKQTDVWLVATGSNDAWMSGMRRLLSTEKLDKETTYFIDIDEVGRGHMAFVEKIGVLGRLRPSKQLVEMAKAVRPDLKASSKATAMPSDAYIPLARGYQAMAITTEPDKRAPDAYSEYDDRPGEIDYDTVEQAGQIVEGIIRRFDQS